MLSDINFLKTLLDSLEEAVIIYNSEGSIVGYNKRLKAILDIHDETVVSESILPSLTRVHSSDKILDYQEYPSTITRITGKEQKDVVLGLKKPTFTQYLNFNTKIVEYNSEKFVFTTILDVTEKYKLSDEMVLIKDRFKAALQGTAVAVWDYDFETKELFLSPDWKDITGIDLQNNAEVFSKWQYFIHKDDRGRVIKTIADYNTGELNEFDIEYRIILEDGSCKWLHSIAKVLAKTADGEPKRLSGTIEDISESKRIAELIKSKEEQFEKAFHHSKVGMALTSPDGVWIDANNALCDILGYSKSELLTLNYQVLTHPEDLAADEANVIKVLMKEQPSYTMEKRFLHRSGVIVWALLTVSMVWNADGTPKFFIAQIIDISQTKALINELETKNMQLEITALNLQHKIEQLEEFNLIVAHNLRGPVGNIMQLGDMLSQDTTATDFYISMLKEASATLDSTLTQLIKLLEIQLNHKVKYEKCYFAAVLAKVKAMLNMQIVVDNIALNADLQIEEIEYPPVYLESILYNLISNAIKYRNTAVASYINVRTYKQEGKVVLDIEDNGLGIDLKKFGHQVFKLNKIFHKGYDSKGLGLFLIKNQIETLGGSISVDSAPDKGSTFKVVF